MIKRLTVSCVLAAALVVALVGSVSAHGAVPARHNGPSVPTHSAGPCAGNWNWWYDWRYQLAPYDHSIEIGVQQQWEGDASNNYCGYMRSVTAVISYDCSPGAATEPLTQVVTQLYTVGGSYLGGLVDSAPGNANCSDWRYWYSFPIYVPCGTLFNAWGDATENAGIREYEYGTYYIADGEDVGRYGAAHDVCYN